MRMTERRMYVLQGLDLYDKWQDIDKDVNIETIKYHARLYREYKRNGFGN